MVQETLDEKEIRITERLHNIRVTHKVLTAEIEDLMRQLDDVRLDMEENGSNTRE